MALQNEIQPTTKVLTFTWHVENGWYGDNYRVVLLKEDSPMCFENAKEAKQYRSKLVRYIKANHSKATDVTGKRMVFGNYAEFETYHYCSMGPSYSCTNIHITVEELEAFIARVEDTWEFRTKQRDLECKRRNRKDAKERKAQRRAQIKATWAA